MKTPPIPCDVAIEKSTPWLENQLSPAEMEQVSEHLESCKECAELFQRLDAIDLNPPSSRLSLGPDYWKSMDKALKKEMTSQWGTNRIWTLTKKVIPVAVVVMILLSWALIERHHSQELTEEIQFLNQQIEEKQERIDRLERAQFQPKPLAADAFNLPVEHVPERHAL